MIVMKPVVEVFGTAGFTLWPVAEVPDWSFQPLHGALTPSEIGTAMTGIVRTNDVDPDDDQPPRPTDPLGGYLHGLLTSEDLVAFGGLQVTDTNSGVVFDPACCDSVEDWRDWHAVTRGGELWYGHEPLSPHADGTGPRVRLTVNAHDPRSSVIELSHTELEQLLAEVKHDLTDFLSLAGHWATEHLPEQYAEPVTAALTRLFEPTD